MTAARDRRAAVIASTSFNGVDFIEIANDAQSELRVHFLNAVAVKGTLGDPKITGGERIATVRVLPIADADWGWDGSHVVLTLRVAAPGDFSSYRLGLPSAVIDPFFNDVTFTFKAGCPSDLDCAEPPTPCPPAEAETPPINYLARDFLSFRQALLDFSALRYPDWQERSEADFGVLFAEALSSVADDFSYMQDRIAAEAALVTATQRRSVARHARLVDYEPAPTLSASTMLQFDVAPGVTSIASGLGVAAAGADGGQIPFETGESLLDRLIDPKTGDPLATPPTFAASAIWNAGLIQPYWFDDSQRCLRAGATSMWVLGRKYGFQSGQRLLIETAAESAADPPIRQIVQLIPDAPPGETHDLMFLRPVNPPGASAPLLADDAPPAATEAPTSLTLLVWRAEDALTNDRDLTRTTLAGNIVPATQGHTIVAEPFLVPPVPATDQTPVSIARTGPRQTNPDGTPGGQSAVQLYTLARAPLTWLPTGPNGESAPEIVLTQSTQGGGTAIWEWFRWLLDAGQFDAAFTIDAAKFTPIARNSDTSIQADYAGDDGDTLRFGDGSFGVVPDDGAAFAATYRVGAGAAGNVAAGAVSRLGPAAIAAGLTAVANPLAASGGADPEPLARVRTNAPQAFRAKTFRAVIPRDYEAAAETLPWVQRAGCRFRWTGSWLTVFTTPDPIASEAVTTPERVQLIDLLNRCRLAGYEFYVPDPRYASVDLEIEVCARPDAFAAEVKAAIIAALSAQRGGFFAPDNFSFGQPLERSALEAAIQRVTGVAGVLCVHYRLRDRMGAFAEMPDEVTIGASQIVRCDNDPSLGEHGSFSVTVEGGR